MINMRDTIKKILREEFEEGMPRLIASYFKFLHRSKPKNVKELKDLMKDTLPMIQKDVDDLALYYQLYKANYRKDGRFDLITKDDFIGPESLPQRTIQNTQTGPFVRNKVPFKGSNFEGFWEKDRNGVRQYVVTSYRWYPVYIFKEDQWFVVSDRYSSSTGRQMSHGNPVEYSDKDLGLKMLVVTSKEMEQLRSGLSREGILKVKKQSLIGAKPELTKRAKNTSFYLGDWRDKLKVKFRIIDTELVENKVILVIKVLGIEKILGHRDSTDDSNTEFELNDINKKRVEMGIYNYIISKYQGLVGSKKYKWGDIDGGEEDNGGGIDYNLPENLIFDLRFEY